MANQAARPLRLSTGAFPRPPFLFRVRNMGYVDAQANVRPPSQSSAASIRDCPAQPPSPVGDDESEDEESEDDFSDDSASSEEGGSADEDGDAIE